MSHISHTPICRGSRGRGRDEGDCWCPRVRPKCTELCWSLPPIQLFSPFQSLRAASASRARTARARLRYPSRLRRLARSPPPGADRPGRKPLATADREPHQHCTAPPTRPHRRDGGDGRGRPRPPGETPVCFRVEGTEMKAVTMARSGRIAVVRSTDRVVEDRRLRSSSRRTVCRRAPSADSPDCQAVRQPFLRLSPLPFSSPPSRVGFGALSASETSRPADPHLRVLAIWFDRHERSDARAGQRRQPRPARSPATSRSGEERH